MQILWRINEALCSDLTPYTPVLLSVKKMTLIHLNEASHWVILTPGPHHCLLWTEWNDGAPAFPLYASKHPYTLIFDGPWLRFPNCSSGYNCLWSLGLELNKQPCPDWNFSLRHEGKHWLGSEYLLSGDALGRLFFFILTHCSPDFIALFLPWINFSELFALSPCKQ